MSENTKILLPPWLAYPEIDRHSIGWRMGYGEDYIGKWHRWYQKLPAKKERRISAAFPRASDLERLLDWHRRVYLL